MSYRQSDIDLLKETIGSNFDFTPASETLSDVGPGSFEADAKAPDLSVLQRERLGVSEADGIVADSNSASRSSDDVMQRFTTSDQSTQSQGLAGNASPNRVYLKRPLQQSDATEAFAPKPVVISGVTGKVTERG